ncbi:MAG: glucosamine-6-phosphate deaminase [Bacillus sp. (in: firmicutes)]
MIFEIIHAKDYAAMSEKAAKKVIGLVRKKPNATLGLATGSTPIGLYQYLVEDHLKNNTTYQEVKTVNLDEYIGLDKEDQNSYFTFMREKLFNHLDIQLSNTNIPNGTADDLEKEAAEYEKHIHDIGGVDLQILGIGHNGHIGFNEPGTAFSSRTHVIELADRTRQANAYHFNSIEEVPTHAITMGIQSIMDSREIILLASGASKAEAIKRLVYGEITEEFPASALRLHKRVSIIADEEALSLI